ncbi:endoplasmic reticulum-Golgi intermediate compartment protein 2 [Palaemon carinicauda]|uniref:endoplasmic reticulum-Golgi intermediate compartment protein 2 n=1 Tax=Palaemon carinicauda TaxID=392227 RepID=UPI0035B61085
MLRHRKKTLQVVKKLDAFPKTSEECVETTTTGGTFSVLSHLLILWLIVMEGLYYMETKFTYTFKPDTSFSEKLKINVDITVAMPCKYVGADVLDMTGEQVMTFGELKLEDTWWILDPDQQIHFEGVQRVNSYLRDQFHSIHELLWRSGYTNIFGDMPRRLFFPDTPTDACQLTGSLGINKVAGNFHITAGKTIPLPRGHAHLAVFMEDSDYNFTHRINKFSFGEPAPGIIHPLEGDEQIALKNHMTYQYFITVVPTMVNTYSHYGTSFQYSVSEQSREISHAQNSHGTPGIFFKYDTSALKVEVVEQHESIIAFLTRLCGIIGGVFTCSGLLSRIVGLCINCLTCRFFKKSSKSGEDEDEVKTVPGPSASLLSSVNLNPPDNGPLLAASTTSLSVPLISASLQDTSST